MPSIYFLCVGNSCRSQMAEGFGQHYLGSSSKVYSAGIEPRGVHPLAIEVMKEKGIDISNQTSDFVNAKLLTEVDVVVTLCKEAKESCPAILPRASHYHWPMDDPAKTQGSEEEILNDFRRVRDEIEDHIKKFIQGEPGIVFDVNKANNHFKQKENFGERIKKIRENKKFTVQEMAEQLKVSNGYLIKTENNQTEPSKFFIQTLAWVCGMEYDDLLDELYYIEQGNLLK